MIDLGYKDWEKACAAINEAIKTKYKFDLQWYPITKLSGKQKQEISSRLFFDKYIKTKLFRFSEEFQERYRYYLSKSDVNLRDVSLLNPIDFYYITALGFCLYDKYIKSSGDNRNKERFSLFYSGDLKNGNINYKQPYETYYSLIKNLKHKYKYFIKFDIQNFYPTINITILIQTLIEKCCLTPKEGELLKDYLLYLGNGSYPLVENCAALSFIATQIYLEEIDINITKFLEQNSVIKDFHCVRYVDDLYILFDLEDFVDNNQISNQLIFEIATIFNDYGLLYNSTKYVSGICEEIEQYLSHSFYGDEPHEIPPEIMNLYDNQLLIDFLDELNSYQINHQLNAKTYDNIVKKIFFNQENTEYSAKEILRELCYQSPENLQICCTGLSQILNENFDILKLDVNIFITLILNTKDERLIKMLLNAIYKNCRSNRYDKFNTLMIVNYLTHRNFANKEFIDILKNKENELFTYVDLFCNKNFYELLTQNELIEIFNNRYYYHDDDVLMYLFNEYVFHYKLKNYLTAFGYFSSFFERITAHIAYASKDTDKKYKKPNYNLYYKTDNLEKLWNGKLIKNYKKIRESNPLIHSNSRPGVNVFANSFDNIKNIFREMLSALQAKITDK